MNQTNFVGRLVATPTINATKTGSAANFTIATNDGYYGKDGVWVEKSNFHECVVYGHGEGNKNSAQNTSKLNKGDLVQFTGSVSYSKWVDKHDQNRKNIQFEGKVTRLSAYIPAEAEKAVSA